MGNVTTVWTISIHGSTRLRCGAAEVELRPRERAVVAALALGHPGPLPLIRMAELVWGLDIPRTYNKSLHNHISRIRRVADGVIETVGDGYQLNEQVIIDRSRSGTTPTIPFAELAEGADVHEHRTRETFHAQQVEDAKLLEYVEKGHTQTTISTLRSAVTAAPLSEMRWRLLVQALAHAGQRRKALVALADATAAFSAAGLDLGSELRDLERRVVDDDVTLRGPVQPAGLLAGAGEAPSAGPRIIRVDDYRSHVLPLLRAADSTSTIALTGPAGIGKTTMAASIRDLAVAERFSVYWTTCSAEPTVAFEPFTDLLHQVAIRHPDELRQCDGAELLSNFVPELIADSGATTPWADREALFDAIAVALRCDPRPAVMVIEDLHWASPYTVQLLQHCQRHPHGSGDPLVFVCTSRVDVEHLSDTTAYIEIEGWNVEETATYVALCDPGGTPDHGRAEWIHQQTGGVALHVRELTLAVLNDPALVHAGVESPAALPPSLVAHLDAQRRELSHSAQRTLAAAAVLGKTFSASTLDLMIVNVAPSLVEAVVAEIVVPIADTDRHQFRHDLLHHVALDAVSPGTLVELHDLAVRALETTPEASPGELARHALASAAVDRARAVRHLKAAAEVAADQYAYEEAVSGYLALRDLLPAKSDQWCEATLEAGRLMARTGDERSQSFLRAAAEAAADSDDEDLVARSTLELCRLGLTTTVGEVDGGAERLVANALEITTEPGPRSMVATAAVGVYLVSGQPALCRQYYLEAVQSAELSGDLDIQANALAVGALALVGPGDLPSRLAAATRLKQIGRETGSPVTLFSGLHLRMANEVQAGNPNMRNTLAELKELAAIVRQRSRDWEVTNWEATVALIDGNLELSEACATAALDYVDSVAPSVVTASYGAVLLGIRVAAGRAGELVDLVRSALEQQPSFGAWHAALALTAASANDPALARRHLDIVLADNCAVLKRDFTFSTALCLAADAAYLVEHAEAANTLTDPLAPWSGAWAWMGTATLGPVDLSLARLAALTGHHEQARSLGAAALHQSEHAAAPLHCAAAKEFLDTLAE